ncbi:MAG: NAD(P)-dependent oxidoreductase [Gammaproteobacteria bacterium]|jgi:nucleoside-diphosphate-sugar epimerase|nr:NAD(P)-dependent oxidoreductase [Gammaproteobacteria bacterium]|tara:strand:- start:6888 stop:7877 length:990 start_codon:yes stop_codon:yes gene_type:complete
MQILVTGGAGFIGFHIAKRLVSEGHHICLVDNLTRGIQDADLVELVSNPKVSLLEVDLLDRDATLALGIDFEAIFHLAAIIGVRHVLKRPYDVLTHNVRMLDNVIALAQRQTACSRLLFASTSEIYAGTLKHFDLTVPTPEHTPLALTSLESPRTSYMLSKIMGEAMVQHSGLPFTIFRPHNIYGPRMGMAHVIPEQLKKTFDAVPGGSIAVYSPDHRRAFCYVDDAIEMVQRMLTRESCEGKTMNLGTQAPEVTIREVVQTCADIAGKDLTLEELPPPPGSPQRRAPDMHKTAQLLDFKSRISLRLGIEKTWQWYRERIFQPGGISAQ